MPCQTRCPDDFGIDAPCRIVKAGGGTVQMSAREPEGFTGGNYTWLTESRKIRLSNVYSPTVTVRALTSPATAGTCRDHIGGPQRSRLPAHREDRASHRGQAELHRVAEPAIRLRRQRLAGRP
ncbi:MAG: hypothetical protein MZV70_47005 [Desulfobacterales bacterium]|nr:hypothetical protein [Desulfobacterales bacterium]